jgi:hypothetical protein
MTGTEVGIWLTACDDNMMGAHVGKGMPAAKCTLVGRDLAEGVFIKGYRASRAMGKTRGYAWQPSAGEQC